MQEVTRHPGGLRAALTAALLTFGWLFLFLLSILSPLLPSLLISPTGSAQVLGMNQSRGGPRAELRKVLEDAALTTQKIGALSLEGRGKTPGSQSPAIDQLLANMPGLAGVFIYRSDGTLLEAYSPTGMKSALRNPPADTLRTILRDPRKGAWIIAPRTHKGTIFYYATPMQMRRAPRVFAVGIVTSTSLGEQARRLGNGAEQEQPVLYVARQAGWPFDWRITLLAVGSLLGLSILTGSLFARRNRRSVGSLVQLANAYGERRFAEPCAVAIPRALEPLRVALLEMAEKLSHGDKELSRRERMEGALSRFFPPSQAAEIADGQRSLNLNGQRRVISVVFVHVAGYSDYVKTAQPTEIVTLLQEIFGLVAELCFRQGGVMDKSTGDSLLALFGAHEQQADHAQRALAAAEDIERFVKANAQRWKQEHAFDVELAIGVSSGEAIVGDLGSETDLEYSAVGEVVSTAARLAAMARPGQILVAQEIIRHLPSPMGFELHPLSEQPLWRSGASSQVLELT